MRGVVEDGWGGERGWGSGRGMRRGAWSWGFALLCLWDVIIGLVLSECLMMDMALEMRQLLFAEIDLL